MKVVNRWETLAGDGLEAAIAGQPWYSVGAGNRVVVGPANLELARQWASENPDTVKGKLITRAQYIGGEKSHEEYYGQFVTPAILELVGREIGVERILRSTDRSFNDIPLGDWDAFAQPLNRVLAGPLKAAGDTLSLSSVVCVTKSAARQIRAAGKVVAS